MAKIIPWMELETLPTKTTVWEERKDRDLIRECELLPSKTPHIVVLSFIEDGKRTMPCAFVYDHNYRYWDKYPLNIERNAAKWPNT